MKILEQNGYKYSRKEFQEYKFRAKFRFSISEDWREDITMNVYTDNPNKEELIDLIGAIKKEKVIKYVMEHWTTKEQDDLTSKFIEETLKDW